MTGVRTFDVADWTAERLVEAKHGRTISLCIPCRNEAATVGPIVAAACDALLDRVPLLDEVIVLDDRSTDDTAAVAAAAGASVVPIDLVHAEHGAGDGKGNALWATLQISFGDVVVWCDGDVTTFTPDWIVKLVAPLLLDETVAIVKPVFERPTDEGGGGRTTELVARPLLTLFEPELSRIAQPLAGECAIRRGMIERLPIVQGWGAEIAMILDIAHEYGPAAIAQVELGERRHRHQPLSALAVQATEVMATALERVQRRRIAGSPEPSVRAMPERPPASPPRVDGGPHAQRLSVGGNIVDAQ